MAFNDQYILTKEQQDTLAKQVHELTQNGESKGTIKNFISEYHQRNGKKKGSLETESFQESVSATSTSVESPEGTIEKTKETRIKVGPDSGIPTRDNKTFDSEITDRLLKPLIDFTAKTDTVVTDTNDYRDPKTGKSGHKSKEQRLGNSVDINYRDRADHHNVNGQLVAPVSKIEQSIINASEQGNLRAVYEIKIDTYNSIQENPEKYGYTQEDAKKIKELHEDKKIIKVEHITAPHYSIYLTEEETDQRDIFVDILKRTAGQPVSEIPDTVDDPIDRVKPDQILTEEEQKEKEFDPNEFIPPIRTEPVDTIDDPLNRVKPDIQDPTITLPDGTRVDPTEPIQPEQKKKEPTEEERKQQERFDNYWLNKVGMPKAGVSALNQFRNAVLSGLGYSSQGLAVLSKGLEDRLKGTGVGKALNMYDEFYGVKKKGEDRRLQDYASYKWGKALQLIAEDLYPKNPEAQESFLLGTLPSAAGSLTAGVVSAIITKNPALAATATAIESSLKQGAMTYEEAKNMGADDHTAFNASLVSNGIGIAEGLPIFSFAGKLKRAAGGEVIPKFANAITQGSEEAIQEIVGDAIRNWTAREMYDADREILEGVGESGAAGFILGAILGASADRAREIKSDPNSSAEEKAYADKIINREIISENDAIRELQEKQIQLESDLASGNVPENATGAVEDAISNIESQISNEEGKAAVAEAKVKERQAVKEVLESEDASPETKQAVLEQIEPEVVINGKRYIEEDGEWSEITDEGLIDVEDEELKDKLNRSFTATRETEVQVDEETGDVAVEETTTVEAEPEVTEEVAPEQEQITEPKPITDDQVQEIEIKETQEQVSEVRERQDEEDEGREQAKEAEDRDSTELLQEEVEEEVAEQVNDEYDIRAIIEDEGKTKNQKRNEIRAKMLELVEQGDIQESDRPSIQDQLLDEVERAASTKVSDKIRDFADTIDQEADKIGKSNVAGAYIIPPQVAKIGLQATASSLRAGANAIDAIDAGIQTIRQSDWYKNATEDQRKEAEENYRKETNNLIQGKPEEKVTKKEEKAAETGKEQPVVPPTPPIEPEKPIQAPQRPQKGTVEDWVQFNLDAEKAAKKKARGTLKKSVLRNFVNVSANLESALEKEGGTDVIRYRALVFGSSNKTKQEYNDAQKEIFDGLSKEDETRLAGVIGLNRIIELDKQRDAQGRRRLKHPQGVNKESAENLLAGLKQSIGEKNYNKIQNRADNYFKVMSDKLLEMRQAGLISKEAYEAMKGLVYSPRKFVHYLETDGNTDFGSKISNPKSGIQSLGGGSIEGIQIDPRSLLADHLARMNTIMAKNKASKELMRFAESNPGNNIVYKLSPKRYTKTGRPVYPRTPNGYEKIAVKVDGATEYMMMEESMAREWVKSDPMFSQNMSKWIKWMTGSQILKAGATGLNPAFALSNFPRDIGHLWITQEHYSSVAPIAGAEMAGDFITVASDAFGRRGRYRDFVNEGGGMEFLTSQGRISEGRLGEAKNFWSKLQDVLGYLGESSEIVVRLMARERSIKNRLKVFKKENGREPNASELKRIQELATGDARDLMDFSQGGYVSKGFDTFMPYLNAATLGLSTAHRAAFSKGGTTSKGRERSRTAFWFKATQVASFAAALAANNILNYPDDWEKISDREKTNNFIFLLPFTRVDNNGNEIRKYIKIPKPQIAQIVASMGEATSEFYLTGKLPKASIAQAASNLMPPITQTPPVGESLLQYASNYDFFRGNPIWYGDKSTPTYLEYYEGMGDRDTPQVYVAIGEKSKQLSELTGNPILELSPERTRNAFNNMTGNAEYNPFTVGTGVLIKSAIDLAKGEDKDKITKDLLDGLERTAGSFKRRFLGETNPYISESNTQEIIEKEAGEKKLQKDKLRVIHQTSKENPGKAEQDLNKYMSTQSKEDQEKIEKSYRRIEKQGSYDNFYVNLEYMSPQARAHVFYGKWKGQTPEKRIDLENKAREYGGIITSDFVKEFNVLSATENMNYQMSVGKKRRKKRRKRRTR